MDKFWDICSISKNSNITCEIIKNNPDIKWDWEAINDNPNIKLKIIKNDRELIQEMYTLHYKPELITYENENEDEDVIVLFTLEMFIKKYKELLFEKERKEYIARYKIQLWMENILLSPKYKIGMKHIEKKMNTLF